jgi:ubiquinone/menaquinone biosynthesis C-methylase UbiE
MGGAPLQVVAIDNSWQMLQEARKYIEQEGLSDSISLVRADVEDMPFINKAFAGITNGAALNEFKHTEPALSETRRTLDKFGNAVFMVQMKARGKVGRLLDKLITLSSGIKFFDRDQLEQYYDRAGFRLLEQVSSGLVTISRLRKR